MTRSAPLDGLRGVAVAGVLACHAQRALHGHWATVLGAWAPQGALGVDVFFVLSGYLITKGMLRSHGQRGALAGFWKRRALRIFPLFATVFVATVAIGSRWYANDVDIYNPDGTIPLFAAMLGNVPIALGDKVGSLLTPLWSLAVEEQFYLLWPLLALGCSRVRGAWTAVAGIALAVAFRSLAPHGVALYFATPARIDQLLVGALLAYAMATPRDAALCDAILPRFHVSAAAFIVLCIGTAGGVFPAHHREWATVAPLLFAVAVAVGVHALLSDNALSRMLSWRPLVAFGRVSFGVYLMHELVALTVRKAIPRGALEWRVVLWALATYAVAWVLYHAVERPFLALGSQDRAHLDRRPTEHVGEPAQV